MGELDNQGIHMRDERKFKLVNVRLDFGSIMNNSYMRMIMVTGNHQAVAA
jgi:hypothetical protein